MAYQPDPRQKHAIKVRREENGTRLKVKETFGPVPRLIRERILQIQECRIEDPFEWSFPVSL